MTEKEQRVYQEIVRHYNENKYFPSIRELQKSLGYKSTNSIYKYLKSLECKGYLTSQNKKKKLTLTDNYNMFKDDVINVPVINTKEILVLKLNKNNTYLAFKIRHDYFNNRYIKKNDYLIIKKTKHLKDYDLGLFVINKKYRIMQYEYRDGFYILKDNIQEVLYKVKIIGKVTSVYRTTID